MDLKNILSHIEKLAPLSFQESYDNAGLITGNYKQEITAILLTIDTTEEVIDEAIRKKCNLIISHHPVIFNGLKKLTGATYTERTVIKAIKNDIAIYSAHTNLDSVMGGVNSKICEKLGLTRCKILKQRPHELCKLVTFIPTEHADKVRKAVFDAGAGHIGNYDSCSYNIDGKGSFRAGDEANPFVGEVGKIHFESEIRFETIFPKYLQSDILKALLGSHPYEEVAYDIYPLENTYPLAGMGMIGELEKETDETAFLKKIKVQFGVKSLRHSQFTGKTIKKVAVCGGSGSNLLKDAINAHADVFVTADFKYHQFFDADNKILIAELGHYESEQFTKDVFYEVLTKNISNFNIYLSEISTNPINHF